MQDDFSSYKTELDRMCLTEESKQALISGLSRYRAGVEQKKSRRLAGTVRLAVVIAAVICLMATAGYAAVTAAPTLLDSVFESGAAYEQSSGFIGKTVDNNGWTVTITDCVGDNANIYVGLELIAPEGTVLDADWYCFGDGTHDFRLNFPDMKFGGSFGLHQLPDQDPTDNRLTFVLSASSIPETGDVFNGRRMRLKLPKLQTGTWNEDKRDCDYTTVCPGKWDFGTLTLAFPDSTIHLEPDLPVTTLGVEATITDVDISPLSVYVRIEGDALKGHHSWVPKNAPDGWYGCIEYQEIILRFDDGSEFIVDQANSDLSGSGCSGGHDISEDGWLYLRRTYSENHNGVSNKLIDVDSLTAISICGVEIPLR